MRRMGCFEVARAVLEDEQAARAIFKDVIVWRADACFVRDAVRVWGVHPSFELVEDGVELPFYKAVVRDERDANHRRMLTVRWQRG